MDAVTDVQAATIPAPGGAAEGEREKPPVYKAKEVPEPLLTTTQLKALRLKPAEGQEVKGILRMYRSGHGWGEFPLYDPAEAQPMRPLSAKQQAAMTARRTCPECSVVRDYVVYIRCTECREAAEAARQERASRTCDWCKRVSRAALPREGGLRTCVPCRVAVAVRRQAEQDRVAAWARTCPGHWEFRCTEVTAADEEYAAAKAAGAGWSPRRCPPCLQAWEAEREQHRLEAAEAARRAVEARKRKFTELTAWAQKALDDPLVVILDTETTGLDDDACIVDIAVIDLRGEALLDTLVNPGVAIPWEASDIHHITDADVAGAPSFSEILPRLEEILDGRRCLIYNEPYDTARLHFELTRHHQAAGHPEPERAAREWMKARVFDDVMIPYSDWVGDWSEYWGNNTWQPLYGGDHRALGDCRAVIGVLRQMAAGGEQQDADPWCTSPATPSEGPGGEHQRPVPWNAYADPDAPSDDPWAGAQRGAAEDPVVPLPGGETRG